MRSRSSNKPCFEKLKERNPQLSDPRPVTSVENGFGPAEHGEKPHRRKKSTHAFLLARPERRHPETGQAEPEHKLSRKNRFSALLRVHEPVLRRLHAPASPFSGSTPIRRRRKSTSPSGSSVPMRVPFPPHLDMHAVETADIPEPALAREMNSPAREKRGAIPLDTGHRVIRGWSS